MHLHAERVDFTPQHLCAALVQLHRHQARREFDHMGLQPKLAQRVGRLQPQQAAANHHTAPAAARAGGDGVEIVQRAVDEAARVVVAGDGRHKGTRAGGEHQPVPRQLVAAAVAQAALLAIDRHHPAVAAQFDAVRRKKVLADQRQIGGAFAVEPG